MKYIKKYETWLGGDKYYALHIKGSIINFQIALDKLGCVEEFEDDWGINDYNYDIAEENMEYFKLDKVWFIINQNMIGNYNFSIRNYNEPPYSEKSYFGFKNGSEAEFGGIIEITDKDIKEYKLKQDINKYNL